MDLEHIDLDKYAQKFFEMSEIKTHSLPIKKERLNRLVIIGYELHSLLLVSPDNKVLQERYIKAGNILDDMAKEIITIEDEVNNFFVFDNFVLEIGERTQIYSFRKNCFDVEMRNYSKQLEIIASNEQDFIVTYIRTLWDKITAENVDAYKSCTPIWLKDHSELSRFRVLFNFGNDLGVYDFIIYLKNRLSELTAKPKTKKVKQERTYDNVFKDKETKKMIEKCLIELRYIDNDKKWRLKGATQELGLFIDVMMSNCLHNDYFKKKSIASMMSQKYMGVEVVKYPRLRSITNERDIIDSVKYAIKKNSNKI